MNDIISCPGCRKPISWKLKRCPHCNFKMVSKGINLPDNPVVFFLVLALGFFLIFQGMKYLGILDQIKP
ncbi:MAG: hypothetical protein K1Y36_15790 [Blastocatellia bacterium]|nr:hypothetical protein [Blastocatellia bacterium]